jgi:hypothetical protein
MPDLRRARARGSASTPNVLAVDIELKRGRRARARLVDRLRAALDWWIVPAELDHLAGSARAAV